MNAMNEKRHGMTKNCEWCPIRFHGRLEDRRPAKAVVVVKSKSMEAFSLCSPCSQLGMFKDDKVIVRYEADLAIVSRECPEYKGIMDTYEIVKGVASCRVCGGESAGCVIYNDLTHCPKCFDFAKDESHDTINSI